jgi:class 3 adenylate cyclase
VQLTATTDDALTLDRGINLPGADRGFWPSDHGWDGGRFLTTVLMTDIVDSTQTVARLGDGRWHRLLAEHYADCRTRVDQYRGALVNTTGDGILAIFDAPARAVRAAIAIQAVARAAGLRVRAGVHTGECAWLADSLAGFAVHVAARICALGNADEVMATAAVREVATRSLLAFEPRGCYELKGVPGRWTVFKAGDATDFV